MARNEPSSGSAETKRTDAGTLRKYSTRQRNGGDSTDTPIQTFEGHGSRGAKRASRSARFVRTWKVCCGHAAITSKTWRMKASGTSAWKRSDIEFTNTTRGRRDVKTMPQHWIDAGFGALALDGIKPIDLRKQLAAWPKFTPKTRNDRRQVLGSVYSAINGRSGYNPVRDVPRLKVRYDEPRGMSYEIIEKILQSIPDKGRPTSLVLAEPGDLEATANLLRHAT